ncbi:GNAT family N-acetyltransferase [Candidatus Sumerlaeota bacterium]|nr:GNAT family N-acetyltransferase [Candidatus Sumerlaeota bacterium]
MNSETNKVSDKNDLRFHEINSINDDLLLPWLDLYEKAFPPEEKVLVSLFLSKLKKRADLQSPPNECFLSAIDKEKNLLCISFFSISPKNQVAFLWYLAVQENLRNKGIGSLAYRETISRCQRHDNLKAAIFEVEIPEKAPDLEHKKLSERRIKFYKRHGAKLIGGVDYFQQVGSHQPPVPMYLMIHPFKSFHKDECFSLIKNFFGDSVTQTGNIYLEG